MLAAADVKVWETYIPNGKIFKSGVLGGANSKEQDKKKDVSSSSSSNGVDMVWKATNQATVHLAKQAGQTAVASKMDSLIKQQEKIAPPPPPPPSKKVPSKKKKSLKREKEKEKEKEEEEKEEEEEPIVKRPAINHVEETVVPLKVMDQTIPIETIEEHNRRDNQLELFAVSVRRQHRPTKDMIISAPAPVKVLAYCAKYKNEMPWYMRTVNAVANSDTYTFQNIPLIRREVLITYLREPDPKCPWERPCFNLDREPLPHETRVRCIAHRMSETKLGPGKGYRLREMQFGAQETNILAALETNAVDPCQYLSPIPEMCYMCHVWMTTEACLDQKNHLNERERKDLTVVPPQQQPQQLRIFNRFMVDIDQPGQYDRRKMLVSDEIGLGVWGPFPLWNERHYVTARIVPSGLRGFEESEALLFRLPRIPLQTIESCSENSSTRSTPTHVSQAASISPQ